MTYRMPFGKHRGKPLSAIPTDYLVWLHNWVDMQPALATAVEAEIDRRRDDIDQTPPPRLPDLRPLANDWYRRLAAEFHPDHRGSDEAMKAINRGREVLLQMLEDAA